MAYPVMPLFLSTVLKAPATAIGNIEGVAESLVSFMKALSGKWSDDSGTRMPFIRWGYGISALGKPLIAAATVWPHVLGARVLDRFGKGLRTTARDALIAEATDPDSYGRAFGFHRAMDTAGAFLGVAIALALLYFLPGQYRLILALAIIPGVLSVLLTFAVHEPEVKATGQQAKTKNGYLQVLSKLPPQYWHALALTSLFGIANTSDAFLLLRAKEMSLADWQTISLYMLYNAVVVIVSTWAGSLSDRIGRWSVLFRCLDYLCRHLRWIRIWQSIRALDLLCRIRTLLRYEPWRHPGIGCRQCACRAPGNGDGVLLLHFGPSHSRREHSNGLSLGCEWREVRSNRGRFGSPIGGDPDSSFDRRSQKTRSVGTKLESRPPRTHEALAVTPSQL